MSTRIQFKRDTAANFTSLNPILSNGEPGLETDTGLLKIGDGSAHWVSLGYFIAAGALKAVAATKNTNTALTVGQHNPVDASGANRAMTLADAGAAGASIGVEKIDSGANTVTITLNLRGTPGSTLTLSYANQAFFLVSKSDGSWWPIASHLTTAVIQGFVTGKTLAGVGSSVTTDTALTAGQHNQVDASGGVRAETLANATSAGQITSVEKTDSSSNAVGITLSLRAAGSTTLNLTTQNETVILLSKADGSWWPIGKNFGTTALKTAMGLNNVTNTSDTNKPISTAQQAAFDAIDYAAIPIV